MTILCLVLAMVSFWFSGSCTAMHAYGIVTKRGNSGGIGAVIWGVLGMVFAFLVARL